MTYECSVKRSEMRGVTTAYGITEKMLKEEGSFEGWGWCLEAFSHEFDEAIKDMVMGDIDIHNRGQSVLVIEGIMPHQNSDNGNPNYDMTCALLNMIQPALRTVEERMLSGAYRFHGINMASGIDNIEYTKAVLEEIMKLAADDNSAFDGYKLKENDIKFVISQLSADERSFKQGTTTLDFFARLDAFIEVLDYDFWVVHVNKAHTKALSLVEDAVLALAATMGMGKVVFDEDGNSVIEDSVATADAFNGASKNSKLTK